MAQRLLQIDVVVDACQPLDEHRPYRAHQQKLGLCFVASLSQGQQAAFLGPELEGEELAQAGADGSKLAPGGSAAVPVPDWMDA